MSSGRSIAQQVGRIGDVIVTQWKGIVTARGMPAEINDAASDGQVEIRRLIAFLSPRWFTLTELQRAKWDAMAKTLGSAYEQGKRMTTGKAGHIIRRQGVLMSGFNLYLRSNILAETSGLSYPRDEAPLGTAIPPSPILSARIETLPNGEVTVVCNIRDMLKGINYYEKVLRVWLSVRSHSIERRETIEKVVKLPFDPISGQQDGVDGQVVLTGFGGTVPFGGSKRRIAFSELDIARILVECEYVVTGSAMGGVVRSAPSNLEELVIYTTEDTAERRRLREYLMAYRRRAVRAGKYKARAFRILAARLGERLLKGENVEEELAKVLEQ